MRNENAPALTHLPRIIQNRFEHKVLFADRQSLGDSCMVKMYICAKFEVHTSNGSAVRALTDGKTDRRTDGKTEKQDQFYYLDR